MLLPAGTSVSRGVLKVTEVAAAAETVVPGARPGPVMSMLLTTPSVAAKDRDVPEAASAVVRSSTASSGASGVADPGGTPSAMIRRAACAALTGLGTGVSAVTNSSASLMI